MEKGYFKYYVTILIHKKTQVSANHNRSQRKRLETIQTYWNLEMLNLIQKLEKFTQRLLGF